MNILEVSLGRARRPKRSKSGKTGPAATLLVMAGLIWCGLSARAATAPGPDAFGYSAARTSSFTFTNITTNTAIKVLDFDDDAAVTVNLGFTFSFYGSNYTQVSFSENGLMTFRGQSVNPYNTNLSIVVAPNNNLPCIAVLWDDWETQSQGPADRGVYYKTVGAAGNRQFIVQWQNIQPISWNDPVTFEARLFEGSNQILLSYLDTIVSDSASAYNSGISATVGIRDSGGQTNNRNLLWSYNQAVITNGLHILFTRTNHSPVAVNDSATTTQGSPVTINVLANDTDVDGNALFITDLNAGAHGTVATNANKSIIYSPVPSYSGQDNFTYSISDGQGGLATGSVVVTIVSTNNPPVALSEVYSVDEDTLLTLAAPGVLGNDSDPNGDALMALLISGPVKGVLTWNANGSFIYLPNLDTFGTDFFVYQASDGNLRSSNVTVTITIRPINDAPVALGGLVMTDEEMPVGVLLRATDVDADALSFSILDAPGNGSLSGAPPNLTYQPATNYFGNDLFTFVVSDGHGGSSTGTVIIAVNPINDPPKALNDRVDAYQNTPIAWPESVLLANDTDPDGDALSLTGAGGSSGTVSLANGSVNYTPPTNFIGSDTFTYTLGDGHGLSATGRVDVTVWLPLKILSVTPLPAERWRVEGRGIPNRSYLIQASSNLSQWLPVSTNLAGGSGYLEMEEAAPSSPRRFYRLAEP